MRLKRVQQGSPINSSLYCADLMLSVCKLLPKQPTCSFGWRGWWTRPRGRWRAAAASPLCKFQALCLTSNNRVLYICKGWQVTMHISPEQSHARAVTPDGWPLSARRRPGQTSHFIQTDVQTQFIKCGLLWGQTWRHAKIISKGQVRRKQAPHKQLDFLVSYSFPQRWKILN